MHIIDLAIIVIVLLLTLVLGLRFRKRQVDIQAFFLAKGQFPSWALGLSLLSTLISSVTFLGYPAHGFGNNWLMLVQGLMVPVVLIFAIRYIVPLYRNNIGLSAYEYFERRFGRLARYYSSFSFVLRQFAGMGTVLFLIAVALNRMTGLSPYLILFLVGSVLVLVNWAGGMHAVVWLDVFQGFMLFASGIICLTVLLFQIKGGWSEALIVAGKFGRTGFGPYDADLTKLTLWVMLINGAFYAIQKYATDQTVVQRYLSAKDDQSAIKASMMGILLTVPVWVMFMLIGTLLFVLYRQQPLPENMQAEAVFPFFIMSKLPVGLIGFVVAALISAAICSLSADLNSMSAVGMQDFYMKWKKNLSDKQYLNASKGFVLLSGVLAVLVASLYLFIGNEGVLGVIFTIYAIFSGGIVGIFLLGLFAPNVGAKSMKVGILSCVLFTAYAFITSTPIGLPGEERIWLDLGRFNYVHHKLMLGVYSHLVLMGAAILASMVYKEAAAASQLTYHSFKKSVKRRNDSTG